MHPSSFALTSVGANRPPCQYRCRSYAVAWRPEEHRRRTCVVHVAQDGSWTGNGVGWEEAWSCELCQAETAHTQAVYVCEEHRRAGDLDLVLDAPPPACEHCGETEGLRRTASMTAYDRGRLSVWDVVRFGEEGPPNPNRDHTFCGGCAADYEEHWTEMWKMVER